MYKYIQKHGELNKGHLESKTPIQMINESKYNQILYNCCLSQTFQLQLEYFETTFGRSKERCGGKEHSKCN